MLVKSSLFSNRALSIRYRYKVVTRFFTNNEQNDSSGKKKSLVSSRIHGRRAKKALGAMEKNAVIIIS